MGFVCETGGEINPLRPLKGELGKVKLIQTVLKLKDVKQNY